MPRDHRESLEYLAGEPIKLNVDGDILIPFAECSQVGVPLPSSALIGKHAGCGGDVAFVKNITGLHLYAVLHCTMCGMRVVLHNEVTDIASLYQERRLYHLDKMPRPA